jgi:ParB family chromosome partitioning protein
MGDKRRAVMVPVDSIHVQNPRNRDRKKFEQLRANIATVGLKKPISVSPRREPADGFAYNLICGQGRMQAFIELGQKEIPAFVDDMPVEAQLLQSLVENLARRTPRMMEMVRQLGALRDRGYTNTDIAHKTGIDHSTVGGLLRLLDQGEERLLQAVEAGRIPMGVAIIIASSEDKDLQRALSEAYENQGLRGKSLLQATRLVEQRRTYGKKIGRTGANGCATGRNGKPVTAESIVRTFEQESKRQRLVIKRAELCETQLTFIVNALRTMLADENLVNLLRTEGLDTMPAYLAERMEGR